jgi:hypothetical protein
MTIYYAGTTTVSEQPQDSGHVTIITAPDDPTQIGLAVQSGSTADKRELYQLHIHGKIQAGEWILTGNEF